DAASYEKASKAELKPQKIADTLAFMWESRYVFRPTRFALGCAQLQKGYDKVWDGFRKMGTDPIFRKRK
ncbi:MAG TPA: homogentisate 1,2-dioxygenase domain-containing protein, partial [Burkholderiales bacterium]